MKEMLELNPLELLIHPQKRPFLAGQGTDPGQERVAIVWWFTGAFLKL